MCVIARLSTDCGEILFACRTCGVGNILPTRLKVHFWRRLRGLDLVRSLERIMTCANISGRVLASDLLKSLEALTAFILHCHVINNRFGFGASNTSDFYAIVRDATVIHSFLNTVVNSFR